MKYSLFFLLIINLYSCNNHHRLSDEIMQAFDSVNLSLEKTNSIISESTSDLYEALEKKFGDTGKFGQVKQMRYAVQNFNDFISKQKRDFIIICGDSTGSVLPDDIYDELSVTNEFFLAKGNDENLLHEMKTLQAVFLANTSDSVLKEEINKWILAPKRVRAGSEENNFLRSYFYMVPPVAAITILNKFENDVRIFENRILTAYLKQ
jgi:hypothetical protein